MVLITLLFMLGIITELELELKLGLICISLILTLFLVSFTWEPRDKIIIMVLLFVSGTLRMAVQQDVSARSLRNYPVQTDTPYHINATVYSAGETRKGTSKFTLALHSINSQEISDGKIILYAKELSELPRVGDTMELDVELNVPRRKRNPHEFDYRKYLYKRGVYYEGFVEKQSSSEIREASPVALQSLIAGLRLKIKNHFVRNLSKRSAGIMAALILGERSEVDDNTKLNFSNTGVIHVLAVSGLHVGYVSLILIIIIGMLRIPHTFQTVLVILGLGFYIILTGGAASVMRASMMASLVLIGGLIERKSDVINILATAAFILLLIEPSQLTTIGFQLSFSAVFSIVLLFPVLQDRIPRVKTKWKWLSKFLNNVMDLFLVSLAAQFGTLALTIYYFHKIPIISLVANLIVVPIIGLIVALGMISLILGSIFPLLAELWGALLEGLIDFMLWFVGYCAQFKWALIPVRSIHSFEVLLILVAVFAIVILPRMRLIALWIILVLIRVNISVWTNVFITLPLEFVTLDVGQGDALILHTPNQKTMVVDTGLRFGGKDMGQDIIVPYLIYRGWETIDLLVLTHPHNDHIGGAQYLVENYPVTRVLMQNVQYDSYGYQQLQQALDSLNIPCEPAFAGMMDSTLAPMYLRVTGPRRFDEHSEPANVNNVSIVMQVFYGSTSLLLTGDAEMEVERHQLLYGDLLQSDIIKAPHHGSRTSSTNAYLTLVNPAVCLISVGEKNKFKHPASETLLKYAKHDCPVHRTDLEGAMIYHSNGHEWSNFNWRVES